MVARSDRRQHRVGRRTGRGGSSLTIPRLGWLAQDVAGDDPTATARHDVQLRGLRGDLVGDVETRAPHADDGHLLALEGAWGTVVVAVEELALELAAALEIGDHRFAEVARRREDGVEDGFFYIGTVLLNAHLPPCAIDGYAVENPRVEPNMPNKAEMIGVLAQVLYELGVGEVVAKPRRVKGEVGVGRRVATRVQDCAGVDGRGDGARRVGLVGPATADDRPGVEADGFEAFGKTFLDGDEATDAYERTQGQRAPFAPGGGGPPGARRTDGSGRTRADDSNAWPRECGGGFLHS